jgi:pilus assembly protein CpaD
MIDLRIAALCLATSVTLTGCDTMPEQNPWTQGESPQHLHVEHLRMKFVADFAPGSAELAGGSADRLEAFLAQSAVHGTDHVFIEAPADSRLAAMRIGRLVKLLDRRGLGAQTLPPASNASSDQLVLLLDRYVVTLPECPNWTLPPKDDHGNGPATNFGCANATNFGLMVDDPRDLVMGRVPGPAESEPGINAIARYRSDKVKSIGTATGQTSSGGGGGATSAITPGSSGGGGSGGGGAAQ